MTDRGPALEALTSERDLPARGASTRSVWVRRGLAGAVLVALAALVGPSLLSRGDEPERPRPRPTTSPQPTSEPTATEPPLSALRWRVRGDLAADARFTGAALTVVRAAYPEAAKVLYAGTLPDGSRIALVGTDDPDVAGLTFRTSNVQALHVPAGAEPAAGKVSYAEAVETPDDLAGWAGRGPSGTVFAVLLGRPAPLDAQVSTTIEYSDDGTISRSWRPVRSRDGSAIVDLGRHTDPLVVARTTYDDRRGLLLMDVDGALSLSPGSRDAIAAKVRIAGMDGSYRGPPSRPLRRAVVDGTWALLDPRHAEIRVLWSGRPSAGTRGALLLVRRADGPTFQLFVYQLGVGEIYPQGVHPVPWAKADLLPWITQTGEPGTPVLLVNPSGKGTAVLDRPGAAQRRVLIGTDGLAKLSDDQAFASRDLSGSKITVLSPQGREVVTTDMPESGDFDPFALDSP